MARISHADVCDFDEAAYASISKSVEDNSKLVDEVVASIVADYSQGLDDVMSAAREALNNKNQLTDQEIEYFILTIPLQLYYSSSAQEAVGIPMGTIDKTGRLSTGK